MLSPQAARMGNVHTTLRKLGARVANRLGKRIGSTSFKSSFAAVQGEIVGDFHKGYAASSRLKFDKSQSGQQPEAWMINLGRGDDNDWLSQPRDPKEWFTGKEPRACPGK